MSRQERAARTIVIVATLDTRGEEVGFLRERFEGRGHHVLTVDVGVMGTPKGEAHFTRHEVAAAGGRSLEELIRAAEAGADRKEATNVMIQGGKKIVADLRAKGRLDGILSLGGTTAAATGASIMKGLPIGLPKLLVTTFLALAPVGDEDLTVMQSPVDLVGLNRIVAGTLSNAAAALMGMVELESPEDETRKLVGITALGVTTPAVQKVMARLEKRGYDSVVFHATSEKLDRMANDGMIDAVLDLTTFETVPKVLYSEEVLSMLSGSGPVDRSRLGSAGRRGLPQIIAPGGLDMHIFPGATGLESAPPEYRKRAWSMHGPNVLLVRTTEEELERIGWDIAERANGAAGPVAVVVPLRGFSEASRKGGPLHDPQADQGFLRALRQRLDPGIRVIEVDCNINEDGFVDAVMRSFEETTASREEKPWAGR